MDTEILNWIKMEMVVHLQADLEEVTSLYLDAKSSAKLLQEQQDRYISWWEVRYGIDEFFSVQEQLGGASSVEKNRLLEIVLRWRTGIAWGVLIVWCTTQGQSCFFPTEFFITGHRSKFYILVCCLLKLCYVWLAEISFVSGTGIFVPIKMELDCHGYLSELNYLMNLQVFFIWRASILYLFTFSSVELVSSHQNPGGITFF